MLITMPEHENDERKSLNITKIKGRLEWVNDLWRKEENNIRISKTEYQQELELEIVILRMLLTYTKEDKLPSNN